MRLRNIIPIALIGFLCVSCGMTNKAVIYFKDGRELSGFGKITKNDRVKFKTEDSKSQQYHFKELEQLEIISDNHTRTYRYLNIKGKDHNKVVEDIRTGRVNLYRKIIDGYMVGSPIGGVNGGSYYSIHNYYVRKNDESEATHLGSSSLFSKNFKKAASTYFADCSSLVMKIQNKTYKKRDLEEIVTFYNTQCK